MHKQDTIAAIGSPPGRGGIGIIRISGPEALAIANRILHTKVDIPKLASIKTRKLFHAILKDNQKDKIDEILVAYLPEERSYTGECSIELNCHGGQAIMAYALETVIQNGARLAEPGEFTRRAVEKGRINLIQAEAINEIIHARTKKAIHAAWKQMDGDLTDKCNYLKEKIILLISEFQACIDFDVYEEENNWEQKIDDIIDQVNQVLNNAEKGRYLTHGCWVVLSGPPNAGKSSLFNNILNIERSLVTDIPGTTRDHISEVIDIDGIEVRLTDTAGIRKTEDIIENLSIKKTKKQMKEADVVIYVLDHNNSLEKEQQEEAVSILQSGGIVLLNKSDLTRHQTINAFIDKQKCDRIIPISLIYKQGLDLFLNKLAEIIHNQISISENPIITSLRQSKLLVSARENLLNARSNIKNNPKYDIALFEIQNSMNCLSEIIGEISNEEILNNIFSKFCIGK